jgi:hypothetical protein
MTWADDREIYLALAHFFLFLNLRVVSLIGPLAMVVNFGEIIQRKVDNMSNFEQLLSELCVGDNTRRRTAEAAYEV